MTKILVVEDDLTQSRLLRKAISARRPDYSVLCSANGREAITVFEKEDIDLVLTDLQMSEMNGFELLAWVITNRPAVIAFTMTAFGNPETHARLASLGSIECFTKPIDIAGVLNRFSDSLAPSIRGHVQNVSLASFLQLLEIEQKTCTLTVRSNEQVGTLFMRKGQLLDARLAHTSGEEAATTIIGWIHSSITIETGCTVVERVIEKPMGYVVMEAMRLQDEIVRNLATFDVPSFDTDTTGRIVASRESSFPPPQARNGGPASGALRGRGYVRSPAGAFVVAVVDAVAGTVLACDGRERSDVGEMAGVTAAILRTIQQAVDPCANNEAIQELVLATPSRYQLIRPLPEAGDKFVMLAFDPTIINLVFARREIEHAIAMYLATATMRSSEASNI